MPYTSDECRDFAGTNSLVLDFVFFFLHHLAVRVNDVALQVVAEESVCAYAGINRFVCARLERCFFDEVTGPHQPRRDRVSFPFPLLSGALTVAAALSGRISLPAAAV